MKRSGRFKIFANLMMSLSWLPNTFNNTNNIILFIITMKHPQHTHTSKKRNAEKRWKGRRKILDVRPGESHAQLVSGCVAASADEMIMVRALCFSSMNWYEMESSRGHSGLGWMNGLSWRGRPGLALTRTRSLSLSLTHKHTHTQLCNRRRKFYENNF